MAAAAAPEALGSQARRRYVDGLIKGLVPVVQAGIEGARNLLDKPSEHATMMRRRDLVQGLNASAQNWHRGMVQGLRRALVSGGHANPSRSSGETPPSGLGRDGLTLVSDDTIELEIVTSRLSLAILDRASWEFADLRSRVAAIEGKTELDAADVLQAKVLAHLVFDAWRQSGLSQDSWRELQAVLHEEFAHLVEESYHEVNRWLVSHGVMREVDLRPFIRRSRSHPLATLGWTTAAGLGFEDSSSMGLGPLHAGQGTGFGSSYGAGPAGIGGGSGSGYSAAYASSQGAGGGYGASSVGEETRMMTRGMPLARSREQGDALLGRFNRLVARHVPSFPASTQAQKLAASVARAVSPALTKAIESAAEGIRQRLVANQDAATVLQAATAPAMLEEMRQRKQALKKAAATPEERATIEIVALLFQSILTEERIPSGVRVWFARLQMPTLRVAVAEPDFFATVDHPARRLIDRMGACVMGFDSAQTSAAGLPGGSTGVSESLDKEIKRIVQVVEAYPDTGRRVFQTVLTEFEKWLEHYFQNENEATIKGVSLAQQVEQRETLAIQYTIELRRMLNEVPVQDGVRKFLFQVWADVLATTAVRFGGQGEQTKVMKRAAADLIWSASAKVSREERAEVIRRLPPLLKTLREGMSAAGMDTPRQDEQIQQLNSALAAAFTAKAAVIPDERLREMMERLETLEELLPDAQDVEIDESMVVDLSGHQSSELEVVLEGGSMPTPAMLAWARELQVGSWYMLERNGASEAVQLAWHGMRKQLCLFVTPRGRCVLFQHQRLASYLQAGLLLPAQDEALTVRATRSALAKLDVDGSGLVN